MLTAFVLTSVVAGGLPVMLAPYSSVRCSIFPTRRRPASLTETAGRSTTALTQLLSRDYRDRRLCGVTPAGERFGRTATALGRPDSLTRACRVSGRGEGEDGATPRQSMSCPANDEILLANSLQEHRGGCQASGVDSQHLPTGRASDGG